MESIRRGRADARRERWRVKTLAFFGGAGVLTAVVAGGPVAIVVGNLAVMAASGALLHMTTNLQKAR